LRRLLSWPIFNVREWMKRRQAMAKWEYALLTWDGEGGARQILFSDAKTRQSWGNSTISGSSNEDFLMLLQGLGQAGFELAGMKLKEAGTEGHGTVPDGTYVFQRRLD
jgi:hypothetical protein